VQRARQGGRRGLQWGHALRVRVLRWLGRHGVIEDGTELGVVDREFTEREPALATLARCRTDEVIPVR